MKKFQLVEYKDKYGNRYEMKLNQREFGLYNLLSNPINTIRSVEEIKETLVMSDNLLRITKYYLSSKLPTCLEIYAVNGKGYFLSETE